MSEIINFDEVEVGGGNNTQYERKTVDPGVDVFTIEETEAKVNTNGKPFVAFKFTNEAGKYFKDQFYLTTANTFKRVKELATNSGVVLGQATPEDVAAKLLGAKVGLIVGGETEFAVIGGEQRKVTRAKIKGAYNFSFKANELEKWKDAKITIEDKTAGLEAPVQNDVLGGPATANDDLPF